MKVAQSLAALIVAGAFAAPVFAAGAASAPAAAPAPAAAAATMAPHSKKKKRHDHRPKLQDKSAYGVGN